MRAQFTILLIILIQTVVLCQTQLVILGTVHEPTKKFTADSITNILSRLNPDLILLEFDSSFFTNDFVFKTASKTNEIRGMKKYIAAYPTPIRPYEIEGRNPYYRRTNYFEKENESYNKLHSVRKKLTSEQMDYYKTFRDLNKKLKKVGEKQPFNINQKKVYNLVEKRQHFKYKEILKIFKTREELKDYREFYKEMGDYWDKRNKVMAQNIIKYLKLEEYNNKTVIVLTGFYHKYYLLNELTPKQQEFNFTISEFYKYE